MLQKGLLLLFIEGLDLIQVQQYPIGGHKGIQLGYDLLDIRRGCGGGIQLIQGPVCLFCDDVGNGGLTRAAGTVENHVGDLPGVDQPPQNRLFSQNMLLSINLVQGLRPQKIR